MMILSLLDSSRQLHERLAVLQYLLEKVPKKEIVSEETKEEEPTNVEENQINLIDVIVEEKPTGEISLGAGVGTNGSSVGGGIKENNFLGKGIKLDTNLMVSDNSVKGKFELIQDIASNLNPLYVIESINNLTKNYSSVYTKLIYFDLLNKFVNQIKKFIFV